MDDDIFLKYKNELKPVFESFTTKLHHLIEDLIIREKVGYAQIECRTKSEESLQEKLKRKNYLDPLSEIKDFSGIRIITYYQDDIKKITDLLIKEFFVWHEDSEDKSNLLDVDEFGYQSVHLVISLKEPRNLLSEWGAFSNLTAEVQIRSVLQHAWASISHKLDYKKASQVPSELRRQLFRLSALLELADEEFLWIRDDKKNIIQYYKRELTRGELDIQLNSNSLKEFIEQKVDLEAWSKIGVKAGMVEGIASAESGFIDILLLTLQAIGISKISEFAQILPNLQTKAKTLLPQFIEEVTSKEGEFVSHPIDILTVLVSLVEIAKIPEDFEWGSIFFPPIVETLKDSRKKLHQKQKIEINS